MRGNFPQVANELGKLQHLLRDGRFTDGEVRARNLLKRLPNLAPAWMFLGLSLKYQKRFLDALKPLQRAAKLSPSDANTHSNLAALLAELGQIVDAEHSYRTALEIAPGNAEVLNNLGSVLRTQGRIQDAANSYREAIRLSPNCSAAYNNLGNILTESEDLAEAIVVYSKAIELDPMNAQYHLNIGDAYRYLDRIDEETASYQTVFTLNRSLGLIASVWLAVRHYQRGSLDAMTNTLLAAKPIMATTEAKLEPHRIYWNYLARLLSWQSRKVSSAPPTAASTPIYVIGESHSLATHGSIVLHHGRVKQCTAQWIAGCKQWHLGNDKQNKYKQNFNRIVAKIPAGATVLLTIGEIDCRLNEGILRHLDKHQNLMLQDVVETTIEDYLDYVSKVGCLQKLIVAGVPATNIPINLLTQVDAERLTALLKIFNEQLRRKVLSRGLEFLDVYELTNRGDGFSAGTHHIDRYHLLPSAIDEAFSNHCLRRQ